jgi:hypothetical protein
MGHEMHTVLYQGELGSVLVDSTSNVFVSGGCAVWQEANALVWPPAQCSLVPAVTVTSSCHVWLAGWLAGWLACHVWLAGWLAGWLAMFGWLVH